MPRTVRIALLLLLVIGPSSAAHANVSAAHSTEVEFEAQATAGLRIVGRTTTLSLTENADVLTLSVPLAALDTGIALRNRHMREALEADKYPAAELVVRRSAVELRGEGAREGKTQATLRVHGKQRPVVLEFHVRSAGTKRHVDGTFVVDLREHDIRPPSYLGVSVKPTVVVRGRFDLTDS